MIEDPRGEVPITCPRCNVCNATQVSSESEDDWVLTYWNCDECGLEWREHFTFTHWDTD